MDLDLQEHQLLDNFPTFDHVKTGRQTNTLPYNYKTIALGAHLAKFKLDPCKRSMVEIIRSKPKTKKYGSIDKKNLEL